VTNWREILSWKVYEEEQINFLGWLVRFTSRLDLDSEVYVGVVVAVTHGEEEDMLAPRLWAHWEHTEEMAMVGYETMIHRPDLGRRVSDGGNLTVLELDDLVDIVLPLRYVGTLPYFVSV